MFSTSLINQALDRQANFHKGEFSNEDVLMLYQYWRHLLDITSGVTGLELMSSYAASNFCSIQSVLYARNLYESGVAS